MALFKGSGIVRGRNGKIEVNFDTCANETFETHNDALIERLTTLGFQRVDVPSTLLALEVPSGNENPTPKKAKKGKKQ